MNIDWTRQWQAMVVYVIVHIGFSWETMLYVDPAEHMYFIAVDGVQNGRNWTRSELHVEGGKHNVNEGEWRKVDDGSSFY